MTDKTHIFTGKRKYNMHNIIIYIFPLLFTLIAIPAVSQSLFRNLSYGFSLERGKLIPGDEYGSDLIRSNGFGNYILNFTYRSDSLSATPYDRSFGYPGIEAGLIVADYSRSTLSHPRYNTLSHIGYIIGFYGKFNRDLFNTGMFRGGYSIANGIGYCTRPYSYPDNSGNEFIGTPFSIYFSAGVYAACRFHPHFEFITEAGFRHFSNSALGRPNKGANTVGVSVGLKYYPSADDIPVYKPYNKTDCHKKLYLDVSAGCNLHTMIETWYSHYANPTEVPVSFPVRPSFSASLSGMYRYHLKFSSGISLDYIYAGYYAEASRIDSSSGVTGYSYSPHVLGISLRHEVHYRRIGFNVGLGYYLHRHLGEMGKKMAKPYYETIGLRYYIPSTPLYVSYHVLAHLLRADSMQFNIGVCI